MVETDTSEQKPNFNFKSDYNEVNLFFLLICEREIDPVEWQGLAIKIFDNPDEFSPLEISNARAFAIAYKEIVLKTFQQDNPDGEGSMCIDSNGRRTDLRAR